MESLDTTALVRAADYHLAVKGFAVSVAEACNKADEIKVRDEDSFQLANTQLAVLKNLTKDVDKKRKQFVDPITLAQKTINGAFKPYSEKLKRSEAGIKHMMARYYDAQQAKARKLKLEQERKEERARKLAEEKAKKSGKSDEAIRVSGDEAAARSEARQPFLEPIAKTHHAGGGSSATFRKTWTFELVDFKSLPERFKMMDENEIRIAIRGDQGEHNIPGLRIFQKTGVAGR